MTSSDDQRAFNRLENCHEVPRPLDVKLEPPSLESSISSLLSFPPAVPSLEYFSVDLSTVGAHRRSPLSTSQHSKPYSTISLAPRGNSEEFCEMSNQVYGMFPNAGMRGTTVKAYPEQMDVVRRHSGDDEQGISSHSYALPTNSLAQHSFSGRPANSRTQSSNAILTPSSLAGAVGPTALPPQFRTTGTATPKIDSVYRINPQNTMDWIPSPITTHSPVVSQASYPIIQQATNIPYDTPPPTSIGTQSAYTQPRYQEYNTISYNNPSPESLSPDSPGFPTSHPDQFTFPHAPATQMIHNRPIVPSNSPVSYTALARGVVGTAELIPNLSGHSQRSSRLAQAKAEDEINQLRKRIKELEGIHESSQARVHQLESALADRHHPPSSLQFSPAQNAVFEQSWQSRREARIRQFCALNRAGNALCAWHDSRRERRVYPPRMAPPGYLNCGCTFDEALFEESLSRHGVGSYLPGETVRMDPALRNPLLALLQRRYNYRDGDFERDPVTGNWVEGEGPAKWEQMLSGGSSLRKHRNEDRH